MRKAYLLPDCERSEKVKYLIDVAVCSEAVVNDSMHVVMIADRPEVKLGKFEVASTYLLPYDPLAKKEVKQDS